MPSKPYMTIDAADRIVAAARAAAAKKAAAVTIAVVDDGGHLVRLDRLDGAPLISLRVAQGKARTALEMRAPTSAIEELAIVQPSLVAINDLYPFRGGRPLFTKMHCIGAVGVSGADAETDEKIAEAAEKAVFSDE